jgi:hypothetical protein
VEFSHGVAVVEEVGWWCRDEGESWNLEEDVEDQLNDGFLLQHGRNQFITKENEQRDKTVSKTWSQYVIEIQTVVINR